MFDAGTIIAHLDLEDNDFDRKLRADVEKIEAFERGDHEIKLNVDVDQAGIDRARAQIERLDRQATADAHRRGGILSWLTGSGKGLASAAGPGLNTGPLARLFNARTASIIAGGGIGLGAVPSLLAAGLGGGFGLAGAGVAALGARLLIGQQNRPGQAPTQGPLYGAAQTALHATTASLRAGMEPLVGPLRSVLREIPQLIRGLEGPLRQLFSGAATTLQPLLHGLADLARNVLPLLGQAFRASAPLLRPLLDGLSSLLSGFLPGVIRMLRAAKPAMDAFGQVLGILGRGLGQMLVAMTPALRASSIIFRGLGDVLGALFPIVGKLAAAFARNLAPVFTVFVGVIRQLLPFLRPIGDVLAKLAGAVLRDLVALLRPLASLLVRIAPSFDILAKALGQTFTVLENTGVFGVLANALERIVPPLARLINDLVRQLAPYFPVIIAGFSALLDILVTLTAAGLTVVLNAIDGLIRAFPVLVPLVVYGYLAFKGYQMVAGWVGMARKAIEFLTAEETIARVRSVAGMIILVAKRAWATAVTIVQYAAQAAAATAAFIAENAATLGIIAGIALLVAAIIYLATHWRQVWGVIKAVAKDVWEFLTHGWGQFLIPQLFLIRKAVEFVRDHWRQAWDDIRGAGLAAWHFIHDYIVSPIVNTFTNTIPNAFRAAVRFIGNAWGDIKSVVRAPVAWVIDHVVDGLISAFDWISGKVGGPHISPVHPFGLATGGRIPGYGGGDRHMALLEGGEAVLSKETTSAHADYLRSWGVPGFQQGGPIGRPMPHQAAKGSGGWLGSGINAIGHAVSGGLHILAGGGKILAALATGNATALANAIRGMIPGGVGGAVGDLAKLLVAIPKTLITDVVHKLVSVAKAAFGSPFTGHYGAGVAQWRGDVLRALAMEGLPLNLASRVLYQMQTESGGNPNAINLTDSNAQAGDPSRGLLQTIMSTFRAYHWPGTSFNIYDPLANIAAAINYAVHRYGPSLMSGGMGMGSGHGYDDGGWLLGPPNYTRKPEAVLNPGQSAAFLNLAEAAHRLSKGGGAGTLLRDVHLMLPEGTTIAEALREIGWALRTTRQQSFAGVPSG